MRSIHSPLQDGDRFIEPGTHTILRMNERIRCFVEQYVLPPLRLLLSNGTVLLAILFVIALDYYSQSTSVEAGTSIGAWAYDALPRLIRSILNRPALIAAGIAASLLRSAVVTVIAQDMMCIYAGTRKGLLATVGKTSLRQILWFIAAELIAYAVFGLVASLFYLPTYIVWRVWNQDLSIALVGAFVLIYPVFYLVFSVLSMVAVMPFSSSKRLGIIRSLLSGDSFRKLYVFYLVRLGIEALLLFILPVVAVRYLHNGWLATVCVIIVLLLPIALFRGVAYEVKLGLLKTDPDVYRLFERRFAARR